MLHLLKLALWNANGLSNHAQELTKFIQLKKIDIMMICETHFTDRSFIKIPNFSIYHTPHPDGTAHGGSAIIVNNKLKHYELPKFQQEHIQSSGVVIEDSIGPIALSSIYCPPKHKLKKEDFSDLFNRLGHRFIVGGDFNAKHQQWGARLTNPRGRELMKAIESSNLGYLSAGEPTYWPTDREKIPDLLDFCVTRGVSQNYLQAESCLDLSSDHSPVVVTYSSQILTCDKPPTLHNKYTDWELFKSIITENINLNLPLKCEYDLIMAVEHVVRVIQGAAWNSTPEVDENREESCPAHIKKAISNKRKLRRKWQNTRHPNDKTNLNRAATELKKQLNELKNKSIQDHLENLTPTETTNYSLWRATKKLKKTISFLPPIKKPDGNWARSDEEKAVTFAEHFTKVFQPFPSEITDNEEKHLLEILEKPISQPLPIKPFKVKEVRKLIQSNLKPKKAPGYDLITGKILKELPDPGIRCITYIFNAVLRLNTFPAQWKIAQIILIPKPGKPPHDVSSYRPISLLPILSKVFERLLLHRIQPTLTERNIIPRHQFGFRKQHATVEQVHRIVDIISKSLEEGSYCSAAFIDISQAFDKVWHEGLLVKIKRALPNCYPLFKSYLEERMFQIKYRDTYTDFYRIKSGVPQGSILGPILYLIFTADFPTKKFTTTATFADDTVIMARHMNAALASYDLQEHLNEIQKWLKTWRIKANESKSVHTTFTMRKGNCPPVTLNSKELPQSEVVKYLGLHLDRRLTYKNHIWAKRKQLGLKYREMLWLLGYKSKLKLENKLLLYKAIIKPIWTYGIQLWGTASNSNLAIIQRFQSKTLRTIVNAPWYIPNDVIHKDLKMKTVKEEIQAHSEKYQRKLKQHPNQLAVNLLDVSTALRRLKKYHPIDLTDRF